LKIWLVFWRAIGKKQINSIVRRHIIPPRKQKRAPGLTGPRVKRTIAALFRLGARCLVGKIRPRFKRGFFIFNASILALLGIIDQHWLSLFWGDKCNEYILDAQFVRAEGGGVSLPH